MRALGLLVVALLLGGCAAPPQLVTNPRLTETTRAKSFRAYKEVLLVTPRTDAGRLGSRLKADLEGLGFLVRVMDPAQPIEPPQGTSFVIGADGWLLTCAHVIGAETVATITLDGRRLLADVVRSDRRADLALLKLREPLPAASAVLSFRAAERPATMGEDVFTIGYPLSRLLGNTARMSKGLLSATAGLRDNPLELQVSAEIHPGNSGGPLLDRDGRVIGVVNKVINPAAVQRATGGALPQNINFAIKARPVLDFVKAADARAFAALVFDRGDGIAGAGRGVAKVQAGIVPPDAERRGKLLVALGPVSRTPAGGSAHTLVALTAVDFESQEVLFSVVLSAATLEAVGDQDLGAMMEQFRKAMSVR